MNKTPNYIYLIFLFFLVGCAYEPILNKKNYQFSINVNKIVGDKQINSIIAEKFKNLNDNEKKYDLTILSKKEKNILSKDSKGDPSIFELIINVKYTVINDGKIISEKEINRVTSYNNISDKFELENYEKNIIKNISEGISETIISAISEINE